MYPEPQPQKPSMFRRLVGIVVLMAILLITSLLIMYGFVINTIFDAALASTSQFAVLPTAAKDAFNSVVAWQLTTYGWIVILVIILAIGGTVAAIFGSQGQPEDFDY